MGCCSSSRGVSNTQSPAAAPEKHAIPEKHALSPNAEQPNPGALHQHHHMNASPGDESSDSSMQISRSFAQNKSIAREMMRLEEMELGKGIEDLLQDVDQDQHRPELKSNENSEDIRNSFGEAATRSVTVDDGKDFSRSPEYQKGEFVPRDHADSYTPFGLIQTQKTEVQQTQNQEDREQDINRLFEEEPTIQTQGEKIKDLAMDLEALYAENLKEHGFDPDKFRNANNSVMTDPDRVDPRNPIRKGGSSDMSSFASSELSSKSGTLRSLKSSVTGTGSRNLNVNEFIVEEEDEDDFMLQELSRGGSYVIDVGKMERDEREERSDSVGYIESIQQSVKEGGSMHNIMDDDDEELMDAILSLDMDEF